MSTDVAYCLEDQEIEDAASLMEVRQIRRLPVLNRDKCLIGIVSAHGIYSLVAGDQIDASGKLPTDIDDYLKSRSWLKKFAPSSGGRPRQIPAEFCASQLASLFRRKTGRPCWSIIAEIVDKHFPKALHIPVLGRTSSKSIEERRHRWMKKIVRRYHRWMGSFKPKPHK
jgi:hypothetical protein